MIFVQNSVFFFVWRLVCIQCFLFYRRYMVDYWFRFPYISSVKRKHPIQLTLFSDAQYSKVHGGSTRLGKRKIRRPIDPKRPLHLTFHTADCRPEWNLRANQRQIRALLYETAKKYGVKVYRYSINAYHLHFLVRPPKRRLFAMFLRVFGSRVALSMTGAKKGACCAERFWRGTPFTRIAEWGRAYASLCRYVWQNCLEARGLLPYQPRTQSYRAGPH